MFLTQQKSPEYYKAKIDAIMAKVDGLESQETFTARDVAIAADLCQQYSDVLLEMETKGIKNSPLVIEPRVDGTLLRFTNYEQFANWLAREMK